MQCLALRRGQDVLDVGCSGKASADEAARQVGRRGRVVSIDLWQALFAASPQEPLHLPFDDGRFDAVIHLFGLHLAHDPAQCAAELWRLVKPGGRLVVTTWGSGVFEPIDAIERAAMDRLSNPAGLEKVLREGGIDGAVVRADGPVLYASAERPSGRRVSH